VKAVVIRIAYVVISVAYIAEIPWYDWVFSRDRGQMCEIDGMVSRYYNTVILSRG